MQAGYVSLWTCKSAIIQAKSCNTQIHRSISLRLHRKLLPLLSQNQSSQDVFFCRKLVFVPTIYCGNYSRKRLWKLMNHFSVDSHFDGSVNYYISGGCADCCWGHYGSGGRLVVGLLAPDPRWHGAWIFLFVSRLILGFVSRHRRYSGSSGHTISNDWAIRSRRHRQSPLCLESVGFLSRPTLPLPPYRSLIRGFLVVDAMTFYCCNSFNYRNIK